MKRWTINDRARLLALLPASTVAVLLLSFFLALRLNDIGAGLQQRGGTLARQFASSVEYGVSAGNREVLAQLANDLLAEPDLRAVTVWNADGEILTRAGVLSDMSLRSLFGAPEPRMIDIGEALVFLHAVRVAEAASADTPQPGPAAAARPPLGWVAVEMSRRGVSDAKRELLLVGIGSALLILVAGLLLAMRIARGITRPLERVVNAVEAIGNGDFSARVPVEGGDDLRRLGEGINRMAERIETAQAEMRREVESATQELRQKRAEADQANIAKSRFLAAASHDLRQPIHALDLFVDLLARQPHSAETANLVVRIRRSVASIGSLLDSLLDISRLDAGAMSAEPRVFPIQAILDRLGDAAVEAAERRLRLYIRRNRQWVRSDPVLLERVLRNLLGNALRYTDRGTVMVAARRRGEALRIEVRDSGIGIDPAAQELVFHEFVQLDNPERNRDKGLGLGLAIVRRLSRLLQHQVGVRSQPGRGSVFWIDVPLASPPVGGETAAVPRHGDVGGCSIVLVDDDPLVLSDLSSRLEKWGCRVFAGHSRRQVEAALAGDGTRPDLILCDYRLADGDDGFAVVDRLRRTFGAAIPAVLMSGVTDPEIRAFAEQRGLPLLYKPIPPARLRATLRVMLEKPDPSAAAD